MSSLLVIIIIIIISDAGAMVINVSLIGHLRYGYTVIYLVIWLYDY